MDFGSRIPTIRPRHCRIPVTVNSKEGFSFMKNGVVGHPVSTTPPSFSFIGPGDVGESGAGPVLWIELWHLTLATQDKLQSFRVSNLRIDC